jgi:hypothetical protein
MPSDDVLRELGRLQLLHGQLDHALRLAIKRMLGISIDDPGYWNETRGMTAALRDRARELIANRFGDDDNIAGTLNKVLDDAEDVTEKRNRALHSVWMKLPGEGAFLQDRHKTLKAHVNYEPPSAVELVALSERLERIRRALDSLTRGLL